MFIKKGESDQAARLFSFLMLGEQIAEHCALEQSRYTSHVGSRRFLKSQARQEHNHQFIFNKASLILRPKGIQVDPVKNLLLDYKKLLDEAITNHRYAETLLAQQVILEGLGEVVLENIDKGMTNRKFNFQKIRHIVLKQEHAHHEFGLRQLNQWVDNDQQKIHTLSAKANDYLDLLSQILNRLHELFDHFGYESETYYSEVKNKLPNWVVAAT